MKWHKVFTIARKAGVAVLGVVVMGLSNGVIPEPWDKVAVAVLAVATYFGVYSVPNKEDIR